jgi:hypothetical protein
MFALSLTSLEKRNEFQSNICPIERYTTSDSLKHNEEKPSASCLFFGKQTTKECIFFITSENEKSIPPLKKYYIFQKV